MPKSKRQDDPRPHHSDRHWVHGQLAEKNVGWKTLRTQRMYYV